MAFAHPAHINSLPLEILSSIFATIVDASLYARSIGDDSFGSTEYPTLISSVCAHWRRVSISTSYLWSYIDLMPSNRCMRNIEHIDLWLERSHQSPLRVRIGKGGQEDEDEDRYGWSWTFPSILPRTPKNQLTVVLNSNLIRVYSFTLKFSNAKFATEALMALLPEEGQHPVRELAIRQHRGLAGAPSQLMPQNKWAQLLEPLHVLHLERISAELNDISCRNLTELHLISPLQLSLSQFMQLLEFNPCLQTVVLDRLVPENVYSPPTARSVNMPFLRYAQLSAHQDCIAALLRLLVPGPHALDLRLKYSDSSQSLMDTMVAFFRRTNIRSLYLRTEGVSLLPILTALPGLRTLGLMSVNFDVSTFAGLESATSLLPKLYTIDLNECNLDDDSDLHPGFRALLSLSSVRRIRHLNCGIWDGDWEKFTQLLEEGGFDATIIQASASDFEGRASPLR